MSDTATSTRSSWAEQAEQERTLEAQTRRRLRLRDRRKNLTRAFQNYGAIVALLTLAAASHGGVFGGSSGYVAAFGGVAVGAAAAGLATWAGLGWFMSAIAVFAGYLLFGGVVALPETTTAGVLPSLQTLQMLVLGVVTSWKDLLTVQPPAGSFVGPAVMPYLASVVCAAVAITIVARTKRPLWTLVPVGALLMLGILWGSQAAPLSLLIGVCFAVLALGWSALVMRQSRSEGGRGTVKFSSAGGATARRTLMGALSLLLVGALASGFVAPMITGDGHRTVLRDAIDPPLDLQQYHSPISQFRWLTTDAKDQELFTVEGLPEGGRVRLATLDTYDGTVFQIAGDARGADFQRVGSEFTDDPLSAGESTNSLTLTMADYSDYWIPGGGTMRSLAYASRQEQLADSLYYSENLGTALSTEKLEVGDSYTVVDVAQKPWTDSELEGKAILNLPVPADSNVPTVVGEVASKMMGDANPGIEQVRALQQKLHDEGFYSDGTDGLSLAGHRTDRLEKFLSSEQMIGNDDQYAVAMALMLRSQGIPSRLVMGFYPKEQADGTVKITGADTHVWVEVPFEDAGWVAFDPTPPEDQTPQTEVPKPKPNPRPQVLQPPDPPEDPAEVPPNVLDDSDNDDEKPNPLWGIILMVLRIVGIGLLILSPIIAIVAAKLMRARRRRGTGAEVKRTAAAWDEVVDSAIDLGVRVPVTVTRSVQARQIDAHLDGVPAPSETGFHRYDEQRSPLVSLATMLDGEVFGEAEPSSDARQQVWQAGHQAIGEMRKKVPWYRRLFAVVSTKSLRMRRTRMRDRFDALVRGLKERRHEGADDAENGSVEPATKKGLRARILRKTRQHGDVGQSVDAPAPQNVAEHLDEPEGDRHG